MTNNKQPNTHDDNLKTAYYSALINGYYTVRTETDKQLLVLSSLAIGFILNAKSDVTSVILWVFYFLSLIFFGSCIVLILFFIFPGNARLMTSLYRRDFENVKNDDDVKNQEAQLRIMDRVLYILFFSGLYTLIFFTLY